MKEMKNVYSNRQSEIEGWKKVDSDKEYSDNVLFECVSGMLNLRQMENRPMILIGG